jgi:hypothetical protein
MSKRELADALAKLKATYDETVTRAKSKYDSGVAAAEVQRKISQGCVNETFKAAKEKADFVPNQMLTIAKSELDTSLKKAKDQYDAAVTEAKRFNADDLKTNPWKADLP